MTMNDVYEISTPNGDIKEIEIDGKTAWERAVDETKTGATPIIANATREGNASTYQIWGNAPYQEHTPSSDNPCEVQGVGGRTENLLSLKNGDYITSTINAIVKNGVIHVFGTTASANVTIDIPIINTLQPDTYCKKCYIIEGDIVNLQTTIRSSDTKTYALHSYGDTESALTTNFVGALFRLQVNANRTVDGFIRPMINKGSTALPYEPFGYEIPIVSRGKNLFDERLVSANITSTGLVAQNSYNQQYDLMIAKIKSGETYTISSAPDSRVIGFFTERPVNNSTTYNNSRIVNSGSMPTTIVAPNGVNYIAVRYLTGYETPQIELGTTATPYVPYREPIETTIYHDEPYFTNDYIRKDKDGGVEHREWGKYVCTGNEIWNMIDQGSGASQYFFIASINFTGKPWKPSGVVYCNYAINRITIGVTMGNAYGFMCWFARDIVDTMAISNWAEWVKSKYESGNPLTFIYELATPTDTEKDLPDIVTASGYNSIDTDTQIKPEKISVTYLGKDGN